MLWEWRIELLGQFRAVRGSQISTHARTRKASALLAYLAYFREREHAREILIELLWPETDLPSGRNNLSVTLSNLRHQLEPAGVAPGSVLLTNRFSVQLNPAVVTTDAAEFTAALADAQAAASDTARVALLAEALERYGGVLLPGWYESWIAAEQQRLAELYFQGVVDLVVLLERQGNLSRAIEYAQRGLHVDPLREDLHRTLMRLYAAAGRRPDALRQYRTLERTLKDYLDAAPSGSTRRLAAEIARAAEGDAERDPVPHPLQFAGNDAALPEAGSNPAAVPDAAPCETEPSAAEARLAPPAGRLPQFLTRFFDREEAIERLIAMLTPSSKGQRAKGRGPEVAEPDTLPHALCPMRAARLVSLTGPGGSGKTRLAVEVARRLIEPFQGKIWFVPLADLTDGRVVLERILAALRLPQAPDEGVWERVVEALSRSAGPGEDASAATALLILDNFEQLLGANPEAWPYPQLAAGAQLVRRLLEEVPTLVCLVTSRQRLNVPGEQPFDVLPLGTPGKDEWGTTAEGGTTKVGERRRTGVGSLSGRQLQAADSTPSTSVVRPPARDADRLDLLRYPSVQLFVDRARAVRPDFRLTTGNEAAVAAVCDRLEGIPLAIELAAARAQVLAPAQMLEQLERRFDFLVTRQQDTPPRHRTLRAAMDWSYQLLTPALQRFFARLSVFRGGWTLETAEAVCGSGDYALTLDYLAHLRDASLILAEERMDGMRFCMLDTVCEFAREHLPESERTRLRERHLEAYLAVAEEAQPHLRGAEQSHWLDRLEGERDNVRAALEWAVESGSHQCALRLATAVATFWLVRGHLAEGRRWLERLLAGEEVETSSPASEPGAGTAERERLRAVAMVAAGNMAKLQGDWPRARALYGEALALYTHLQDPGGAAAARFGIANIIEDQGAHAEVASILEECLVAFRAAGDRFHIASVLNTLGNIACRQSDFAVARRRYEEGLAIQRELGEREGLGRMLNNLALAARYQGDVALASAAHEESLGIQRQLGNKTGMAYALNGLGLIARDEGDYELARRRLEACLALCRDAGHKRGSAYALNNLGSVALLAGDAPLARSLLEEALALFREMGEKEGIAHALNNLARWSAGQRALEAARSLVGEALRLFEECGNLRGMIQALREFVRLALLERDAVPRGAESPDAEQAVRILAAAEAGRKPIGLQLAADEAAEVHAAAGALRAVLGDAVFEAAWSAGRAVPLVQATNDALRALQGQTAEPLQPIGRAGPGAGQR